MAGGKEIRNKIKSIKSTQKITRAMEMVAASKMRRAQDRMKAARPYAEGVRSVIAHLAKGRLEYQHPFLVERPAKRVGYIVVSSDRGLCGGLNANLFKACMASMLEWDKQNIPVNLALVGKKGAAFFQRFGGNIVAKACDLGDEPKLADLIGVIKVMLDAYFAEEIDRIYLVFNEFVTTMNQKPVIEQLVPVLDTEPGEKQAYWDYLYEPSAQELLESLLIRYVESIVYEAAIENVACEQAARMVAMKSASDNAGDLIAEFQLAYNKARQAAITQELSEIVAGAAAV